jgi:chromosome partitioning related protein ParA
MVLGTIRAKIYGVMNTKGGVGKSTLAANLAAMLADMGKSVLLVDGDQQQTLSRNYPISYRAAGGLIQVFRSGSTENCISRTHINNLDIIINDDPRGDIIPTFLRDSITHFLHLRKALRNLQGYDYVIVDTQGAKGVVQESVILTVDTILSPVVPQPLDTREFVLGTVEFISKFRETYQLLVTGQPIPPMRVVINQWDKSKSAQEAVRYLRSESDKQLDGAMTVLNTLIPDLQIYADAAGIGSPVHREETRRRGPTRSACETMLQLVHELEPKLLDLSPEWK